MKKSFENYYAPTATVSYSRLPIFAPVKRLSPHEIKKRDNDKATDNPITFNTPYGTCTIVQKARLTQIHRDFIEAIITFYKKAIDPGTGDITFLVNPYELFKKMGTKNNVTWLKQVLEDMRVTKLTVNNSGWNVTTGIVLRYYYQDEPEDTAITKFGKGKLFAVEFSREFMASFGMEINVHYPMLVDEILAISSPLIRATVRFFLTHANHAIGIDKVLHALGVGDITSRGRRQKIQELRENSDILERFGITLENGNFRYTRPAHVGFSNPNSLKSHDTDTVIP